jgi:hypothetical protein
MRARTWGIVILVNAIISAAVVLVVLLVWRRPPASDTASPELATPAQVTATVNAQPPQPPSLRRNACRRSARPVPIRRPAATHCLRLRELRCSPKSLVECRQINRQPPDMSLAAAPPSQRVLSQHWPMPPRELDCLSPPTYRPRWSEIREVIALGMPSEIAVVGNSGAGRPGQWTL